MAERGFQTELWTDPFIQGLPPEAKLLFIYLWTNKHCNQAGLYEITLKTMAFDTGLPQESLPALLKQLEPKVAWYQEQNLIWVKNFLKRQAKSSSFLEAAAKTLNNSGIPEDLRSEFYLYNQELLRSIPVGGHISLTKRECVLIRDNFRCQYCGQEITEAADYAIDHIIPVTRGGKDNYCNLVTSCRSCNRQKLDRTPAEAGLKEPQPSSFHAAQAGYILKNDKVLRKKWLEVFPKREAVIESILVNVNQCQSTLSNVESEDAPYPLPDPGPSISAKGRGMGKKGVVKGEEKPKTEKHIPRSRTEAEETLCEGDREVISVWRSVKGFDLSEVNAKELVARLRTEFTDLDILAESKAWSARKLSEPLKRGSKPASQLWNWMRLARKFAQERRPHEQRESRTGRGSPAHKPDFIQSFTDAGGTVIVSGEEAEAGNEDGGM